MENYTKTMENYKKMIKQVAKYLMDDAAESMEKARKLENPYDTNYFSGLHRGLGLLSDIIEDDKWLCSAYNKVISEVQNNV